MAGNQRITLYGNSKYVHCKFGDENPKLLLDKKVCIIILVKFIAIGNKFSVYKYFIYK